ncbi:hypothetical protein EIP86_002650 [Pleurotus ostreatoroseus]|nr:hypothetical protein EIP86_002650 [Pleurotus ostreatoroseus]
MSPSPASTVAALFAATVLYVLFKVLRFRRMRALMPPGPPGLPVLGNVLQVPKEQAFRQFADWGNTYGPIISLDMAGQPVVVVNSLKVATDLFDRRSAIYSSRPRLIMPVELFMGGNNIWRKQRRAVHEAMNIRDVSAYNPTLEKAAVDLVSQLLNDKSGDWRQLCNRAIAAGVTSIVYGNILANKNLDEFLEQVFEVVHRLSNAAGKDRYMVEYIPSMLLLPDWMAKFKRDAAAFFQRFTALFEGLYEDARLSMHEGDNELSFCCHLMRNEHRLGLSTRDSAWLAAVLMKYLDDNQSTAVFAVFFLVMLRNPDVMRRAQAEIDAVVGRDRLPTLDDLDRLPYIYATIHELLRWWPVAPLSLPHSIMEDDWYDGYFIPKGTTVLQNLWAIGRDPEDFPEPDRFKPERFLHEDSDGSMHVKGATQKPFAFGFGRRICPGSNVAMRNLFIEIACVLWAFDISPFYDEKGEPVIPSETDCLDDGLVT